MNGSIFLSTPSARRATSQDHRRVLGESISIHALREEGDGPLWQMPHTRHNFYPRPPRGGRHFLLQRLDHFIKISIHALREEGDRGVQRGQQQQGNFYPRPPRGGRQKRRRRSVRRILFLSTPSARRATRGSSARCIPKRRFLSTPSARRATCRREV